MNAYVTYHLSCMWGFYILGCVFVGWLIVAGLVAAWRAITRAPDAHEDRSGFHHDGGAS